MNRDLNTGELFEVHERTMCLVQGDKILMDSDYLTSVTELRERYPTPSDKVFDKEKPRLDEDFRAFVAASPFLLLATSGENGLDCSPRGDEAGFVRVSEDGSTLMIPDRPGNNRLDSLRNIIEDPKVGLLFLIPGISRTLRINGSASLSIEPELLESFATEGRPPGCVVVVSVETAFAHCARSLNRAGIWKPETFIEEVRAPEVFRASPESGR